MAKTYTWTQIMDKYEKTTKDNRLAILSDALDYMQQYNGRSKMMCIALAMGYDNYEGEVDTFIKRGE